MPTVAIPAHFDGKQIVLDEPFDLPINAHLLVTLLPAPDQDVQEDTWLKAVVRSDAFSFLADDAEDIYTAADGEPFDAAK